MYAKQPDGFAVKEEITDYSPNLELIFQLEGNKSAYINPPYTHNRIQGKIRLWDRLKLDKDPDRFVLYSSALIILLFKYTRNENIIVDVQKKDQELSSEVLRKQLTTNVRLNSCMNLLEVADQIAAKIKNTGENEVSGKRLNKQCSDNFQKSNVLFIFGPSGGLSDELKKYRFCVQINPNGYDPDKYALITAYYSPELFDSWYVSNMIRHYRRIFYRFIVPNTPIRNLKIISAAEHNAILEDFNRTEAKCPSDKTIQEQFEEQVRLNKDKTAVIAGEQSLSYSQLNDTSNRLARRLKQLYEIKPNDIIGLLLGRSEHMICGMLGVLKSGGAFLPLDPGYPNKRLKYMINDAAVKVLVSESKYLDLIKDYSGAVLLMDKASELQSMAKENLPITNTSRDLVYIMYTSGSTGNPKGVLIEHQGLFNTEFWRKKFYGLDETYVTLQIASFSFDSAINDIFSMLMWGGTLVIVDEDERLEPKRLRQLVLSQSITNFNVVPSFYNLLLDELDIETKSLRVVTLAGEKLTTEIVKRHFERFPDVPIVNEYGPTENSICTTATMLRGIWSIDEHIGKPIDNARVFIINEEMEIVPPGVSGEICISGPGLSRGYLNNPELTAEKFLPNPFAYSERIYLTGDLGRWTAEGNLEFRGRIDHQVKVRGFRVELGEVETALLDLKIIKEAVVVDGADKIGATRLIAYLVCDTQPAPSDSSLRSVLTQKLPYHMIPSAFIIIDRLPLLPNGKLDRNALPAPGRSRPRLDNPYAAPRTPVEEALAEIWAQVLGIDQVGINDSFFDLGGHSLLATQIISRVINTLRVKVPLRFLFQAPTIADMAVVIVQNQVEKAKSKEIDRMLSELEALSDGEARQLFNDEHVSGGNGDERS